MADSKLKPCPFCGGEARIMHDDPMGARERIRVFWEVCCTRCLTHKGYDAEYEITNDGIFIVKEDGRAKAIRAWNRRAGDAE